MAHPMVGRVIGYTKAKWWTLVVVLVIVVGVAAVTFQQRTFANELRAIAQSNIDYLMLCDFRRGVADDSCRVIDASTPKLRVALGHMSNATTRPAPGKTAPTKEMMLRVGRGAVTSKKYLGCFRIARFVDVEAIYISAISTDPECTRIEKYRAGEVAIPGDGFGYGAI